MLGRRGGNTYLDEGLKDASRKNMEYLVVVDHTDGDWATVHSSGVKSTPTRWSSPATI